MPKRLGSHHGLNNINNIHAKASEKYESSSSNISSSDYDSFLSSDNEWDKITHSDEHK